VAQRLLAQGGGGSLHTFSARFDAIPECDERSYQEAVLAQGGFTAHTLGVDALNPLNDLECALRNRDEPVYGPGLYMHRALARAASEQGVRVLLDGHGGDETVSHGYGYLHELAVAGHWMSLAREVRGVARVFDESFWGLFGACVRNGVDMQKRRFRIWRGLWGLASPVTSRLGGTPEFSRLVNPEFAQRIGLVERRRAWAESQADSRQNERELHFRVLSSGLQPFALEALDGDAATFSIEPRYPFWDKRLVEFCLALPSEQKLHGGWTRLVLRRAMEGVLPRRVQWRAHKTNFLPSLSRGLLALERERLDDVILEDPGVIEEYVDLAALRAAYGRFVSRGPRTAAQDVLMVWWAISFALWLRLQANVFK
jgi:asparagine synthase (glutamine-hydrolysing)